MGAPSDYRRLLLWLSALVAWLCTSGVALAAPRATVIGAEDGADVKVTARHGRLETYVNVDVETNGEAEVEIQVAVSPARFGNEVVPLHIFLAQRTEQPTTDLLLPPGQTAVGIHGVGFEHTGSYEAKLSFSSGGEQLGAYHLEVVSEDPYAPLGLRASELRPPRVTDRALCIPVDADREDAPPIRVAVGPSAAGEVEGSRSLPTDIGVAFTQRCAGDQVELTLDDLEPGVYSGAVEVNGEPLEVRLTILQPWWLVMVLVAVGATLSIASRDLVRHARERATNEEAIADAEAQLQRRPQGDFVFDELIPGNAIRAARAANRFLRKQDVQARLTPALAAGAGSTFSARPEYAKIRNALEDAQLPTVNAVLWRIQQLTKLSSRKDEAEIDRELQRLAAEAGQGFPGVFDDWLARTAREVRLAAEDAQASLDAQGWTGRSRTLIERALGTLEQYIVDAYLVALPIPEGDGRLAPLQLALVERTVHAARALAEVAEAGPADFEPDAVEGMIFGTLPDPSDLDHERGDTLPPGLELALVRGADDRGRPITGQEVDFELRGAPDALRGSVSYTWYIDGEHVTPGGPRLTWVFAGEGEHDVEVIAVARGRTSKARYIWTGTAAFVRSRAVSARTWRWVAEKGATAVGVVIAGAIAVAMVWSERSYGDWADYVALLATGLGVEVGIGSGPTLVRNVLASLRGRSDDASSEERDDA